MSNQKRKPDFESSVREIERCDASRTNQVQLVLELIDHVHSEVKEIDEVLAWNKSIGHRNPSRLKVVRDVYVENVVPWLEQLRDKMMRRETPREASEECNHSWYFYFPKGKNPNSCLCMICDERFEHPHPGKDKHGNPDPWSSSVITHLD